ncbi:hypothetical protein IPC1221_02730 [Pseudomonas aeruginosa]|nr:hypothetical protein IPC1221_02730 [Pseudomonas aeruginosa]
MPSDTGSLMMAADHLMKKIDPPTEMAVSIGTFFRPGRPLAIRVLIRPQYSYLMRRVPEQIDGFEVLREVVAIPTAS